MDWLRRDGFEGWLVTDRARVLRMVAVHDVDRGSMATEKVFGDLVAHDKPLINIKGSEGRSKMDEAEEE